MTESHADDVVTPAAQITPRPLRLFILARLNVYIEGLITIIGQNPRYDVVACAQPGSSCFVRFTETDADLVLVHEEALAEPLDDFFELFRTSPRRPPILVLGPRLDNAQVCRVMCAGASGYINDQMRTEDLYAAIEAVRDGRLWLESDLFDLMRREKLDLQTMLAKQVGERVTALRERLNARELEVLRHALSGRSTAEIATRVHLSEQGVKMYLGRLFRHFDAGNRTQLLAHAFQALLPELSLEHLLEAPAPP